MVYEIKCNGCGSIYVGQTSRHVTTSISQHQKKDPQVRHRLVECRGSSNDIEWKILHARRTVEKLVTIGAIYISNSKSILNWEKNRAKIMLILAQRILQNLHNRDTQGKFRITLEKKNKTKSKNPKYECFEGN